MAETIRFPLLAPGTGGNPAERSEVITLLTGVASFLRGGPAAFTPLTPWKLDTNNQEAPFTCIMIEFLLASGNSFTIGDGTTPIGLYGEIIDAGVVPNVSFKTLLGLLGVNFAGTTVPQIPLDTEGGGDEVGFSQVISNVAAYDRLSVGAVGADIMFAEGDTVTVRARPFHRRVWAG